MSEDLGIDQAIPSVPVEEETGGPVIDLTAQGEDNKALVRRFYAEAFNQGELALVDELSASDFLDHNPLPGQAPGVEGVKQTISMMRAAFPDLRIEVQEQVGEGDIVVSRLSGSGTHRGEFMGISATGRRVGGLTGFDMVRIAGGKAVERWGTFDQLGMLQQLGITPQMAAPRGQAPRRRAAKKSTAKKGTAKKSAKKPTARKSTAKKSAAKRSAAKKRTVKSTAKKSASKR